MDRPPIYWQRVCWNSVLYGRLHSPAGPNFVVINECVGALAGLYGVSIVRAGRPRLHAYAGSVEAAQRHVERWVRRHWRTVEIPSTSAGKST